MEGHVVVRKYAAPHEAALGANYLRQHDIFASVDDDVLASMDPLYAHAFGGVRLQVLARDAERANELLNGLEAAERAARAERDPTTRADRTAERAFAAAIIGVVTLPGILHAYSLWLAFRVERGALSARGKRRLSIAIAIDFVMLAVLLVALTYA